jgi:hypothetical protein
MGDVDPVVMLSLMLFIWPQITSAPAFRLFAWLAPPELIGVSMLICGVACIVALLVNGASLSIGPRVRAWSALARAILWLQFGISTLQAGIEQGYPYTVQPFWFTFALAELWVAYRAVLDVRTPH